MWEGDVSYRGELGVLLWGGSMKPKRVVLTVSTKVTDGGEFCFRSPERSRASNLMAKMDDEEFEAFVGRVRYRRLLAKNTKLEEFCKRRPLPKAKGKKMRLFYYEPV